MAWLALETKGLLIGESADPDVIHGIKNKVMSFRDVLHINDVLTMHMGPEYVLVNLSVEFSDAADTDDIEDTVVPIDRSIKKKYKNVKRVFIEAEDRRFKT